MGTWIEHDGGPHELRNGTPVTVRLATGQVLSGRIGDCLRVTNDGRAFPSNDGSSRAGNCWEWHTLAPRHYHLRIVAYRLEIGPQPEAETRAHRENLWRDWLKDAESLADNPYPVKKREGTKQ